jgi:hypothetical protein
MNIYQVAMICHEANKTYCETVANDDSQPHWWDAPDWQKDSAIKGVEFHLDNPDASASASHDAWMADKIKEGWVYGEVKNPEKKQHPCIVPFEQLPVEQQIKDHLFKGIVHSLALFVNR